MTDSRDKDDGKEVIDLLEKARAEGDLSKESFEALTVNADVGAQIQAGLGVVPDDVPASEVVLLTMMPDDSGSIAAAGNERLVADGHNLVISSLLASKQRDSVIAHTRYLNGHVLFPYRRLPEAIEMNRSNFQPNLSTPLYDQTLVLLGTVLAKTREFEEAGIPARTMTLILSDGGDNTSVQQTAATLKPIVEDMLRREIHILAAMGIDDGSTDFRDVFRSMGIPDRWILTPGNTPSEIRSAFQVFSQSAARASQSAALFAKTAAGGFVN